MKVVIPLAINVLASLTTTISTSAIVGAIQIKMREPGVARIGKENLEKKVYFE